MVTEAVNLPNISIGVPRKKESHAGLERHEGEFKMTECSFSEVELPL